MPRRHVPLLSSRRRTLAAGLVLATACGRPDRQRAGVGRAVCPSRRQHGGRTRHARSRVRLRPLRPHGSSRTLTCGSRATARSPDRAAQPRSILAHRPVLREVLEDHERRQALHVHAAPRVKFPSGKPVDAKAVKYSFQRSLTMGGCGGYFIYDGLYTPPLIKSMTTPNPTTFVVNLSVADPNVLQDWAQPAASIVDKSVVDAHGGVQKGKVNTWMSGHVAGVGPFTLQVVPAEPAGRARVEHGLLRTGQGQDDHDQLHRLRPDAAPAGEVRRRRRHDRPLEAVGEQPEERLEGQDRRERHVDRRVARLVNNVAPFDNEKFREAMSYAVPYQDILGKIAYGYGTLFYGPITVAMPEFNPTLEKARPPTWTRPRRSSRTPASRRLSTSDSTSRPATRPTRRSRPSSRARGRSSA